MKFPITKKWELHNLVPDGKGWRTRPSFTRATVTLEFPVAAFSVESPSTSEVWHYIFTQDATSQIVTLNVYNEQLISMYALPLGPMQPGPIVTYGVVNNQLMVSSPSFSSTLYGQLGGGMVTAVATPSEDPTIVTLDVPTGHIFAFADRIGVASGSTLSVNDARRDVDPRTFTSLGLLSVPGTIFDAFQGVDGQAYLFTSDGVFTIPPDALSVGQGIAGTLFKVPGIFTKRPRNACPTPFGVVVVQQSSLLVLDGGSQREIPIGTYQGRRKVARVTDADDLRVLSTIYPTAKGVVLGFSGDRPYAVDVDLSSDTVSYITFSATSPTVLMNVVGVLRSRDGDTILVTPSASGFTTALYDGVEGGPGDVSGNAGQVKAFALSSLDLETEDEPRVRRLTVAADNIAGLVGVTVNGVTDTDTTPTLTGDAIVGTSLWDAASTFVGRSTRTTRMTVNVRTTAPDVEVEVDGSGVAVGAVVDVELGGLNRQKRDRQR